MHAKATHSASVTPSADSSLNLAMSRDFPRIAGGLSRQAASLASASATAERGLGSPDVVIHHFQPQPFLDVDGYSIYPEYSNGFNVKGNPEPLVHEKRDQCVGSQAQPVRKEALVHGQWPLRARRFNKTIQRRAIEPLWRHRWGGRGSNGSGRQLRKALLLVHDAALGEVDGRRD